MDVVRKVQIGVGFVALFMVIVTAAILLAIFIIGVNQNYKIEKPVIFQPDTAQQNKLLAIDTSYMLSKEGQIKN